MKGKFLVYQANPVAESAEQSQRPLREFRRTRERRKMRKSGIATCKVQRLSMRINTRERLRWVVMRIEEEEWEIVLLSHILEERRGVIWFGEEEK